MKFYLLLEGRRTEKILYKSWLGHCFPQFTRVEQPQDLTANTFFLAASKGYPFYLQQIPAVLEDCARNSADHLFICVDAEERSYEEKRQELTQHLQEAAEGLRQQGLEYRGATHLIVANCCIESWLLGNRELTTRESSSQKLSDYRRFYDVSKEDPERMESPSGFSTRARFHLEYLREIFRHCGKAYTKTSPGMAREADYLAALRNRCQDGSCNPPHLASFRHLWDIWQGLGARLDAPNAPSAALP
jgi:hypothetical protein